MHAPTIRPVPISKIREGKNVRPGKLDASDLVESFRRGTPQLQNVVVRPLTDGRFELVAGFRRLAAARKLGWSHLDAKVIDVADERQAELIGLEENLRRKSLPNQAQAVARLLELYRLVSPVKRGGDRHSARFRAQSGTGAGLRNQPPSARVARLLGKSERDVRRLATIGQRGIKALQKALADGKIGVNEAEQIARLPAAQQERRLAAPDTDRNVKRALQALAYVRRTITGERRAVDERLAAEIRTELNQLVSLAKKLKTKKAAETKTHPVAAIDFQSKAANRKLSPVQLLPGKTRPHFKALRPFIATTSTSIQATCPDSCTFKGDGATVQNGCYAESGFTKIKSQALDDAGHGVSADAIAEAEANALDKSFRGGRIPQDGARGGRDLRLHVFGDCTTAKGARHLASASERWRRRGGGSVFTFTHSWRTIPRSAWGKAISVLASVERAEDIEVARKRGYPAAIVVAAFPEGDKAFTLSGSKTSIVPCPAETKGTTCTSCRLCLDHNLYETKTTIAFAAHGRTANIVKEQLVQVRRRAPLSHR